MKYQVKKNSNYLIFAHYHSKGLLRKDILDFLKKLNFFFDGIVFVSTKLDTREKLKLPKFIKIITRKNIGYDFYSYKIGLNYFFKKDLKLKSDNKNLFFINSSIMFVDCNKLSKVMKSIKVRENQFCGITKSYELTEHVQSYFFYFSSSMFRNKKILSWWKNIRALNKRQEIIDKYELGLSNIMKKNNFRLCSIFTKNLNLKKTNPFHKIKQRYREIFYKDIKLYKKNPMNYFWKDIYQKFGLLKIELIKTNPKNIDISKAKKILKKKNLEIEALNN